MFGLTRHKSSALYQPRRVAPAVSHLQRPEAPIDLGAGEFLDMIVFHSKPFGVAFVPGVGGANGMR